jgi:hypothetical protein
MTRLTLSLLAFLACVAGSGNEQRKVQIQPISVHREGKLVRVDFKVINMGTSPVYLEDAIQTVQVERHEGQSWVFVGPGSDVTPSELVKVGPSQKIERSIQLVDPQPSFDRVRRPIPLRGEFRASLRYFRSREAWLAFKKRPTRGGYNRIFSEPFKVPAGDPRLQPQ